MSPGGGAGTVPLTGPVPTHLRYGGEDRAYPLLDLSSSARPSPCHTTEALERVYRPSRASGKTVQWAEGRPGTYRQRRPY